MQPSLAIRPLSLHEASFPQYAKCSPGAGNIVALLSLEGNVDVASIRKAIEGVINDNEALRVHYRQQLHTKGLSFEWAVSEKAPPIEFIDVTAPDIESAAQQQMERLMNTPFNKGEPLSRYMVLSGDSQYKLLASVSHASMDGGSIINVLQQIVDRITNTETSSRNTKITAPLWNYMPIAIAERLGIFRCLGVFALLLNLQRRANKGLTFAIEAPAPASEHRCMITRRQLTANESESLVALAKQHRASVHGLLGAAITQAFIDYLRSKKGESFCQDHSGTKIPFVSTIDMRRRTSPSIDGNTLGCLSSGATHMVMGNWRNAALSSSDYIKIAHDVDRSLNTAITKHQPWKLLRIYQLFGVPGMLKLFRDAAEKPMSMPLSLANVGKLVFPSSPELKVTRFEAAPAFHANAPSINVQSYTTNGELTLSFSAAFPQMSRATFETFSDNVIHHLRRML